MQTSNSEEVFILSLAITRVGSDKETGHARSAHQSAFLGDTIKNITATGRYMYTWYCSSSGVQNRGCARGFLPNDALALMSVLWTRIFRLNKVGCRQRCNRNYKVTPRSLGLTRHTADVFLFIRFNLASYYMVVFSVPPSMGSGGPMIVPQTTFCTWSTVFCHCGKETLMYLLKTHTSWWERESISNPHRTDQTRVCSLNVPASVPLV